jgi:phenylalanyl-tRNA synthetase beta subunit
MSMRVSYNWLQEHIDGKLPDAKTLGDILTAGAYEVEAVIEKGDDFLFEIDVQPNRAHDSFAHYGIAREISVLTGLPLIKYGADASRVDFETEFSVEVRDKNCRRYTAREIRGIKFGPSPDELKKKLEVIGQRSINNIVDCTNIVMFDLGQPLHAFDSDKLSGKKIFVKTLDAEKEFTTLDNKEVKFAGTEMVIADEKDVLAIAGIKGGKKAEVAEGTVNLLLESANFDSVAVRKTRRALGIDTESSKRFEREITPVWAEVAMNRLTDLLLRYASDENTKVGSVVDIYPRKAGQYKTGVSVEEVNRYLGTNISEKEVSGIFDKLNFEYKKVNSLESVVENAKSFVGKPYKNGASVLYDAPEIFDCSSFTSYLYKEAGVSIPRMSVDQFVFSTRIEKEDLTPGDLIFSNTGLTVRKTDFESIEFMKETPVLEGVDHLGIYLGNEEVIHCTQDQDFGVVVQKMSEASRFKNVVGYGRIVNQNEERFVVNVPNERIDVRIKEDLIEEIARVYGYKNIQTNEVVRENPVVVDKTHYYSLEFANFLLNLGYTDVMTYTLRNKGDVEISNPLTKDKGFMRNNLSDGLKESLEMNIRNMDLVGLSEVKIFEIGKVFKGEEEFLTLGIANSNLKSLKQTLEEIKSGFNLSDSDFVVTEKVAEINLDKVISKLPEISSDAFYKIQKDFSPKQYKTFSVYPFIVRDIAVWVPKEISEDFVFNLIKENSGELVVQSRLFDKFEKDEKVSYAFRIVFQSYEKTLTDEEINKIMEKVSEVLNSQKDWNVR